MKKKYNIAIIGLGQIGSYLYKEIILKKGKRYSICTCGASAVMPFCDGRHREVNEKEVCNYKSIKIISEKDTKIKVHSSAWDS